MKILEKMASYDRKYALSLALALIMGLFAVYTFIYEKKPDILYEIISESNILEIKEQVGKLKVLFDGIDIQENKMNLRIIILSVRNTGGTNILKDHFDTAVPLGLRSDTGKIVDVGLLNASSDYLLSAPRPRIESENTVLFDNFIFDKNNSFTLKILILHDKKQTPSIIPLGKVAGIKKIIIRSAFQDSEPSVFSRALEGTPTVQVLRLITYSLSAIIIIILILFTISRLTSFGGWKEVRKDMRRRKQLVKSYKETYEHTIDSSFLSCLQDFVENKAMDIYQLEAILDDKESIKRLLNEKGPKEPDALSESPEYQNYMKLQSRQSIAKRLVKRGIVSVGTEEVKVSEGFVNESVRFLNFLKANDYAYKYREIGIGIGG